MLHVHAEPVEPGVRHHLRWKSVGNRKPAADRRFAFTPKSFYAVHAHVVTPYRSNWKCGLSSKRSLPAHRRRLSSRRSRRLLRPASANCDAAVERSPSLEALNEVCCLFGCTPPMRKRRSTELKTVRSCRTRLCAVHRRGDLNRNRSRRELLFLAITCINSTPQAATPAMKISAGPSASPGQPFCTGPSTTKC